jgi:hypothetical protein
MVAAPSANLTSCVYWLPEASSRKIKNGGLITADRDYATDLSQMMPVASASIATSVPSGFVANNNAVETGVFVMAELPLPAISLKR